MREATCQDTGRQARYRRSAASGTSQAGSKASSGSRASYCQASRTEFTGYGPERPAAYRPGTCAGLQRIRGHNVGKVPITSRASSNTLGALSIDGSGYASRLPPTLLELRRTSKAGTKMDFGLG